MEKIKVESGRVDHIKRWIDPEDGWERFEIVWAYHVGFSTAYGIAYTLMHTFPDTPEGAAQAERIAARVQAVLDTKGIAGLDSSRWVTRTIYGSRAYCNEEHYIVERERSDAQMGLN